MLTVYLYDGTPIDVWSDYDIPENSTLIPPTDGLYQPIQFDPETETWSGGNGYIPEPEEPEEPEEPNNPTDTDFLNAQLISNDIEHNAKIKELQQDIANLTTELLAIKGGTDNVSDS